MDTIILANSHWGSGGGGNSSQQYARALSRMGYAYFFIGPKEISRAQRIVKRNSFSPRKTVILSAIPYPGHFDFCQTLKEKGCKIVYRITDLFEYMPENHWYEKDEEANMIKLANTCYASSQALVNEFKEVRSDIMLLQNAVDEENFKKIPKRMPKNLKKGEITIGFWGMFWVDFFDWNLITSVAQEKNRWTFNIIGGEPRKLRKIMHRLPSNINLIGQKRWEDLYSYLYYFDVCIIPYMNKRGSDESNPIKALEYLAGYKPVISYCNESLKNIPYIYFYTDKTDFINKIVIANKVKINLELVNEYLKKNTWEYRFNTILHDLNKLSAQ